MLFFFFLFHFVFRIIFILLIGIFVCFSNAELEFLSLPLSLTLIVQSYGDKLLEIKLDMQDRLVYFLLLKASNYFFGKRVKRLKYICKITNIHEIIIKIKTTSCKYFNYLC